MDLHLTDDQTDWLAARVASGEFASAEEALLHVLDEAMSETIDIDDLDWAKPLIEEAQRSIARGDVISLEDHRAHTAALLARLGVR